MAYTFRKDLFVGPNGPMIFCFRGCRSSRDELREYIEFGGGVIDATGDPGPYTITLCDERKPAAKDRYFFQPDFILNSCKRNEIQPLAQFCCSASNTFTEEFDPAEIMYRRLTWDDAKQLYLQKKDTEDTESSSCSSICETSIWMPGNKLTKATGPTDRRSEFTQEERKRMVDLIVQMKAFDQLRGVAIWQRISTKFDKHTWQSLKEHFFKKVMPLITMFNLPPPVLQALRNGAAKRPEGQRRNHVRGAYSSKEDAKILDYVAKKGSGHLGGNEFWKKMARAEVVQGRSWHSLRERYLKYLKGTQHITSSGSHVSRASVKTCRSAEKNDENVEEEHESDQNENDTDSDFDKPSETKIRKKRRLFAAPDTPEIDALVPSPISVKSLKRPTMLEILARPAKKRCNGVKQKLDFPEDSSSFKKVSGRLGDKSSSHNHQSASSEDDNNNPPEQRLEPVDVNISNKHQSEHLDDENNTQKKLPLETEELSLSQRGHTNRHDTSASQDLFASSQEEGNNVPLNRCSESPSSSKTSPSRAAVGYSLRKTTASSRTTPESSPSKSSPSRVKAEQSLRKTSSSHLTTPESSPKKSSNQCTPEIILPQWPSNFTPEVIKYVGEAGKNEDLQSNEDTRIARVERVEISNVLTSEGSDWSEDELLWCGARDTRDNMKNVAVCSQMPSNQFNVTRNNPIPKVSIVCNSVRSDHQGASERKITRKDTSSQMSVDKHFNFEDLLTQSQNVLLPNNDVSQATPVFNIEEDLPHESCSQTSDVCLQAVCPKSASDKSTQTDPVKFAADSSTQTDLVSENIKAVRSSLRSLPNQLSQESIKEKRVSFSLGAGSLPPSPKYYPAQKP